MQGQVQDIASLNRFYSRYKKLFFEAGPGGFPLAKIRTDRARATIAMYGGQLVSFKPTSSEHDLFYLSKQAVYQPGKAIRGGVPLCWPWFGDDPDNLGRQAHGFVRNQFWELLDTRIYDNVVNATFGMDSTATTKQWWDADFSLRKILTIGDDLTITLTTKNKGKTPLTMSEALHSYFLIGDIQQTRVSGLDGTHYQDKTLGFAEGTQQGDIVVSSEFDRIYLDAPRSVVITDPALKRKIKIEHEGAENFVVWNPWDKAQTLSDMPDEDFNQFICVETANAHAHSITVQPGETHTMQVRYVIEQY